MKEQLAKKIEAKIKAINEAREILYQGGCDSNLLDTYFFEDVASEYLTIVGEDNNDHNMTQLLNNRFDGFMSNEELAEEYRIQQDAEADYYDEAFDDGGEEDYTRRHGTRAFGY